ncbi:ABC transporter permease [Bradyrhizobium sp. CB1650]|uniref:ABC transporter permease n=1 Tax=Bradyrhizobium sp. CB1650 TaxID=3039153 RepID=UPI00243584EC|nr:ABC transporter permease [Bradyrhizobium sp. CB1650]WGD48569.1 ABC transporter permease [Bradyrhizobium sp. CB1650]
MGAMLKQELSEFFSRPLLWLSVMAFGVFLVHVVAHLSIEEEDIRVAIYQTDADNSERLATIIAAEAIVQEMSNIRVLERKSLSGDVASQLLADNADVAITRTDDGWRFLVKARSELEHKRLVRMAQVLGASLSQQRPWPLIAYSALQISPGDDVDPGWPRTVQISGTSADPGAHARVFVPKTIALLSFMAAFAFACRSLLRDISSNVLETYLVACHGRWREIVVPKVLVAVLGGLLTYLVLLTFALVAQGFYLKNGFLTVTIFEAFGWVASALFGVTCVMFARTESRIYLLGSGYLILLVMLSGLIAKISEKDVVLSWLASIIPLSYSMDVLSDWMCFGMVPLLSAGTFQIMLALVIVTSTTTVLSVWHYQRQL